MSGDSLEPRPFRVERAGHGLAGEEAGEGPPVVLVHGLTATRRYVVHGSKLLARRGFRTIAYDARGHGESDPAPPGEGYGYPALVEDLAAIVDDLVASDRVVLAGHSMGAHTATAYALAGPDRVAALIAIGPVSLGTPTPDEDLERWDELAAGLESGGVDGFMAAFEPGDLDPGWRETVLRFTRDRLERHRHPEAVAQALREVPRSVPFEGLAELESLEVPTLVVASHDDADPGHPRGIAEAWAQRIPGAELRGEEPGASPLAWQGGRLSREIAEFLERPPVRRRLDG